MNTTRPLFVRQKLLFLVLVILALLASRIFAATYVVNSMEDRPDADPLDGVCSAAATGECTLRAAIMEANVASGADTIVIPPGVYQITRVASDGTALAGDLDITGPVTVQGAGAGSTIVDGNGQVTNDRVFHILSNAGTVAIQDLTIRHGNPNSIETGFYGGAIHAANRNLTLTNLLIEENTSYQGGGLYIVGNNGAVLLSDLVVQNNGALNTDGGGIALEGVIADIRNVAVHGNSAVARGGGLNASGSALTMSDCQISNNNAGTGGGFAFAGGGARNLVRCEIFANTATSGGGGLANDSGDRLTLTECYLHNNKAGAQGGGAISNAGGDLTVLRTLIDTNSGATGGGLMLPDAFTSTSTAVSIESSTLTRNTAQYGGAIYYAQSQDPQSNHSLTLLNSTVFGNQVSRDGGGIYAKGVSRVFAVGATIASNVLSRSTGLNPMRGGGVFLIDVAKVYATNTIVADNYFTNTITPQTHLDDIYTATTTRFHNNGWNLIETTSNVTFSGDPTFCIFDQDPNLDPAGLGYHGGATPTVALLAGSLAINAGNSNVASSGDQRGFGRVAGADIGAYEAGGIVPPVTIMRAASRKTHGNAGDFDVNLSLSAPPSVECRSGGVNGEHTVIFTFANPLTTVESAAVTAGSGSVASAGVGADPRQAVVNLMGVANQQDVTITLNNVADSFGYSSPTLSVSLGLLAGDTNGNGTVNASDVSQTKANSGQVLNTANFRSDVTVSGSVNASDVGAVKAAAGTALP